MLKLHDLDILIKLKQQENLAQVSSEIVGELLPDYENHFGDIVLIFFRQALLEEHQNRGLLSC